MMRSRLALLAFAVAFPLLAVVAFVLLPGVVAGQGGYEFLLQPAEVYGVEDLSQPPSTIACDYSQGGGVISCTADIEPYSSPAAIVNVVLDAAPSQAVALLIETDSGTGYWRVGYGGDGRPVWWRNAGPYGFPLGSSTLLNYGPSGSSVGLPGSATFPFDASAYALGTEYSPGRPAGRVSYQHYTTVGQHVTIVMRFTWVLWDEPTPTPAPTGTPPPPPPGGRFGERCVYTPTLGGPPVEGFASVLENGGFETWDFMIPPPWVASAPGGFVPFLGPAYEGERGLSIDYHRPANYWQYFQVYDFVSSLPTGDWRANVGFAAMCFSIGLPAYDCPIGFAGADFTVATSGNWRVYSATVPGVYPVDGGSISMGELTAGDGALILDAMWVIYEHLGEGGLWEVWCPEPRPDDPNSTPTATATPWAYPTLPLPTLQATPTFGPQPTVPPPVAITPRPTSCFEVGVDASEYGLDIPSVGVCLEPAELVVTSPILEPIVYLIVGLIGAIMAAVIVAMILQLFRIGQ